MRKQTQISFAVTVKLISAFVFATRIVKSLYFLNSKFQASCHLLWLYSPVCVGPGRKPRRPVFLTTRVIWVQNNGNSTSFEQLCRINKKANNNSKNSNEIQEIIHPRMEREENTTTITTTTDVYQFIKHSITLPTQHLFI